MNIQHQNTTLPVGSERILEKRKIPGLRKIFLDSNRIGNAFVGKLARVLPSTNYRHLTTLSLSFNQITAQGAFLISEAIESGAALVELDLSSNFLGVRGVESILSILARGENCSIRRLRLHECGIGGDGCAASTCHELFAAQINPTFI